MKTHNFTDLVTTIELTDNYFLRQAQKQVNTALTVRNWLVGFYIVEYEQHGTDRAEYGEKLLKKMAVRFQNQGIKGLQERNLYLCKDFYKTYPYILQSATAKSYIVDFQAIGLLQSPDSIALLNKLLEDTQSSASRMEQFSTDPNTRWAGKSILPPTPNQSTASLGSVSRQNSSINGGSRPAKPTPSV